MNFYALSPGPVARLSSEDDLCTNLQRRDKRPEYSQYGYTSGYWGTLNEMTSIDTLESSRIYPTAPNLWLNVTQDLYSDIFSSSRRHENLNVYSLFHDPTLDHSDLSDRLMIALGWFNRSTSMAIEEEISLVYTAIALETLLNLKQDKGVTERFKETIQVLLGHVPKLDIWADQFYDARSNIIHDGTWPHLKLYPAHEKKHPKLTRTTRGEGVPYGSLTAYGQRIFRLCVNAILAGALSARQAKLGEALIDNQSRMKSICEVLENKEVPPLSRLANICKYCLELHEFSWQWEDQIDQKVIVATSRQVAKTYLALQLGTPKELKDTIQHISSQSDNQEKRELWKLTQDFNQQMFDLKQSEPPHLSLKNQGVDLLQHLSRHPLEILWVFYAYTKHHV
jgi:hypothetical protein